MGSTGDVTVVADVAYVFHQIIAISNCLQLLTNA